MADRRLLFAGGAVIAALVVASIGLLTAALRSEPEPVGVVIALPTAPDAAPAPAQEVHDETATPDLADAPPSHAQPATPAHDDQGDVAAAHAVSPAPGDDHASPHPDEHASADHHGADDATAQEPGHGDADPLTATDQGLSVAHDDAQHAEDQSAAVTQDEPAHQAGAAVAGDHATTAPEVSTAARIGVEDHGEAPEDHGLSAATPLVEPEALRLVVVATGIAWNDELTAAAMARLPMEVALALPADLPEADRLLQDWRAAGREVVVRFAWHGGADDEGETVPLEAAREIQAGRLETQWRRLDGANAGVIVEPSAAAGLEPVVGSLAQAIGKPMLLGTSEGAEPPAALRVDPALLGEAGLELALERVVSDPARGEARVLLIELYPALLDPVLDWIAALEGHGVTLTRLVALDERRR